MIRDAGRFVSTGIANPSTKAWTKDGELAVGLNLSNLHVGAATSGAVGRPDHER
jgi:hypothetical protein